MRGSLVRAVILSVSLSFFSEASEAVSRQACLAQIGKVVSWLKAKTIGSQNLNSIHNPSTLNLSAGETILWELPLREPNDIAVGVIFFSMPHRRWDDEAQDLWSPDEPGRRTHGFYFKIVDIDGRPRILIRALTYGGAAAPVRTGFSYFEPLDESGFEYTTGTYRLDLSSQIFGSLSSHQMTTRAQLTPEGRAFIENYFVNPRDYANVYLYSREHPFRGEFDASNLFVSQRGNNFSFRTPLGSASRLALSAVAIAALSFPPLIDSDYRSKPVSVVEKIYNLEADEAARQLARYEGDSQLQYLSNSLRPVDTTSQDAPDASRQETIEKAQVLRNLESNLADPQKVQRMFHRLRSTEVKVVGDKAYISTQSLLGFIENPPEAVRENISIEELANWLMNSHIRQHTNWAEWMKDLYFHSSLAEELQAQIEPEWLELYGVDISGE